MLTQLPYRDFAEASQKVLKLLHSKLGFDLWMVTRTEGEDWIILSAEDHGYGVEAGSVLKWADSFCSQMVLGRGPCIAPVSDEIPAYAAAPIGAQVPIAAYIGMPICDADGELFGTLCAINPEPKSVHLGAELPMIEVFARLLSTVLVADLRLSALERQRQKTELPELVDAQHQIFTADGWKRVLDAEERRCTKFGHPAYIVGLASVSSSGDWFETMVQMVRAGVYGSESMVQFDGRLVVLIPECNRADGDKLLRDLQSKLDLAGVPVKVFGQVRSPTSNLQDTVESVLAAMQSNEAV